MSHIPAVVATAAAVVWAAVVAAVEAAVALVGAAIGVAAGAAVEAAVVLVGAAERTAAGAAVEDVAALILSLPPTLGNFGRNVNGRPCILGPHWLGTWLPALVFSCHRFIDISTLLW